MPDTDPPASEAPAAHADPAAADPAALADAAAPAPAAAPAAPTPVAPDLSPAACAARLAELFPALFGTEGPFKPLKLRIQADIQQRAPGLFTKRVLSVFLSRYTTSTGYLKALTQSPHRYDLDGQPAGDISDEHRQLAAEELARRREVHHARRAAEREAQRAQEAAARQQHFAEAHARRDRAALLRAFETATLTKANFCALKGLAEPELEALLAQAREERAQRPPEAPQEPRPEWGADRPRRPADRRGPPRTGGTPRPAR